MTIRYQCTECDSVLKIRDDKAGQAGRCPKCKTEFVIPEPDHEPDDGEQPEAPAAAVGTGDAEDDAMAFLMESGGVSDTAPQASTSLDVDDEMAPAIPPAPPTPEERELHRPATRPQQVDVDDTANAAGQLLAQSESDRAAVVNDEPAEPLARIDLAEVRQTAMRRVLPIAGGIIVVVGICFYLFNMMTGSSDIPTLAAVSGTITLDGKPLSHATVSFEPPEKGNSRTGSSVGRSNADGVYTLTYTGGHDGAVPGIYTVRIHKTDEKGVEVLAKKYHLQSRLKHEVKTGSNTINLDLKSEPGGNVPVLDPLVNPLVNPLANPTTP